MEYMDGFLLLRLHAGSAGTTTSMVQSMTMGTWMRVPTCTGSSITASFGMGLSKTGQLKGFFFRLPQVQAYMRVNGSVVGPYRFIWSVSDDGILMSDYSLAGIRQRTTRATGVPVGSITSFRIQVPPGWFANGPGTRLPVTFSCRSDLAVR
jgi:hypothetical protein